MTTLLSIVPLPSETTEDMLWEDIKIRLDRIEHHAENILDEWFHIGRDLEEIRGKNDSDINYSRAAKRRGIVLSPNMLGAARWWFLAEQKTRDDLHIDSPNVVNPETLQKYCRENPQKYPGKATINKSRGSGKSGTKEKSKNSINPPIPGFNAAMAKDNAADIPEPKPLISAKRQKELDEELYREQVRQQRAARQAKEQEKAAKDNRPRLAVQEQPVVMYGVQLWPVNDPGYDYDQMFFAILQFTAWQKLIGPPGNDDHRSRGIQLRARTRHLRQFIERRLEGQSKNEMLRFTEVIEKLASLYRDNPAGECHPPIDASVMTNV